MKRYRIVNKVRFTAVISFCLVIGIITIAAVSGLADADAAEQPQCKEVRIEAGDTLWNIALQYKPDNMDTREFIYKIECLNNVRPSTLQAGMTIQVPML